MSMNGYLIAVVSGGMDSITMAALLLDQDRKIDLVSFDYGQRHRRELDFAREFATTYGLRHDIIDLSGITRLISTSSLTSTEIEVPDGHYAEETMRQTVVPNRNAMMLNIAAGIAISRGADGIATGVHSGDHYIYPDCRPRFIDSLESMLRIANEGFAGDGFEVVAPFVHKTKADIVSIGWHDLALDYRKTWSCYKGGEIHCGSCGTCFERREAFELAGVSDPTSYLARPDYADPR